MSETAIKADRYAKFRKLGQFEEHVVVGGAWRETREERAKVRGHSTLVHCELEAFSYTTARMRFVDDVQLLLKAFIT